MLSVVFRLNAGFDCSALVYNSSKESRYLEEGVVYLLTIPQRSPSLVTGLMPDVKLQLLCLHSRDFCFGGAWRG